MTIEDVTAKRVMASLPVSRALKAWNGFLHGGSVVARADTCCGYGTVRCIATPLHKGRSTQVRDAVVTAEDSAKALALFRCTQMILWPKRYDFSIRDCRVSPILRLDPRPLAPADFGFGVTQTGDAMQTALTGSQPSISIRRTRRRLSWLVLTGALVIAPTALAADSFGTLLGAWSGEGQMHLDDGQQEAIACTAGYKEKDAGKKMTMTLTCDSDRYKVDLRSRLTHKDGALSGGWFEKIREVSGSGKGRIDDQSVSLHLNAIGFSADLKVVRGDCTQAVELIPESGDVKRVTVEMKKSGC